MSLLCNAFGRATPFEENTPLYQSYHGSLWDFPTDQLERLLGS